MADNYLIKGPLTQIVIGQMLEKAGTTSGSGGHSVFLGQVRADEIEGKVVKAIEYSAYEGLVKTEADKIIETIRKEFNEVKLVQIIHSIGYVKAGELSLFVLVSAIHRNQAIQACSKTVELIKLNLPVWKKEIFNDDSHGWK